MTAQARSAARGAALSALVASALASGCGHAHHRAPPPPVLSFVELEPNDTAFTANYLGAIRAGEAFLVRGSIEDSGLDPFDGFALTALGPLDVELRLWIDEPFADLDLCVFDPATGAIEACFETAANPETGWLAFAAAADFHLVVASYSGDSSYTLEVLAHPVGAAPAATAAPEAPAPLRERERPFAAYAAAPGAPAEPAPPRVLGRAVLIDPATGRSASQDFSLGPEGLQAGRPVLRP
jgi:hypothetical protein